MKKLIILCLMLISYQLGAFSLSESYLILDAPPSYHIPRHLRTFKINHSVYASGSGQFSEYTFEEMLDQLAVKPCQLIVFDLREESHGLINGTAVSWTDGTYNDLNRRKTLHEIERDEQTRLLMARKNKQMKMNVKNEPQTHTLYVKDTKTEREFITQKGAHYIRLPVPDHFRPSDQVLDQFIEYMQKIDRNQWVHFHCKAGKGRTTTFLVLLDAMNHASELSLEEILKRQHLIGGIDLKETNKKNDIRSRAAQERLELIKRFYNYCQQVPDFHVSWSTWSQQQAALVTHP